MNLSRLLGKGSGTSIGGWIGEKFFPSCVSIAQDYSKIIFITGTNGKTTTRSLINHILSKESIAVCSNLGGANIFRGIASTILQDLTLFGQLKSKYLVLEVEEATLPRLSQHLKPDILVLTNIFRDQLDAYGEIDKTLEFFISTIETTDPITIINSDDEKLVEAIQPHSDKLRGFSVKSREKIKFEPSENSKVDKIEKNLIIEVTNEGDLKVLPFEDTRRLYTTYSHLAGTYNIYNIAAAIQTCSQLFDTYDYINHIPSYKPAFGRGEHIRLNNTSTIDLFLVKNPAGYDSVLNHINNTYNPNLTHLICALNDNIADGRDVSWIWDVEFEKFQDDFKPKNISTLGTRKYDMLLRLEYANFNVNESDAENELKNILEPYSKSKEQNHIIILATYTALLEIRKQIENIIPGYNADINKDGN